MTTDKHIDAPAHTPGRLHIRVWDRLSGEQNVMSEVKDTALWAVSIQGPDDIIATADYLSAVKIANAFNAWWQELRARDAMTDYHPRMWALPVEWPWKNDGGGHASSLANGPGSDYEPFVTKALASPAQEG